MKKVLLSVLLCLFLLVSYSAVTNASGTTVTGAAYFKSSLLSSYMEKHGYVFIEESSRKNIFAAEDAEIIIKNKKNKVIGYGKTDKRGNFSISVPEDDSYKIIVKYHGHEKEYEASSSNSKNFTAYLGYFSSDEVGDWIDAKLNLR